MTSSKILTVLFFVFSFVLAVGASQAEAEVYSTVGAGGYDLVSYHQNDGPKKGTGAHIVEHDGVNYLFSSEENKKKFEKNPHKYIPEYGGWCAYGTAVGKKFIGDPEVWKIVNGKLYLNLNKEIQNKWETDLQKNIATADKKWSGIKDKSPGEL